MKYLFLLGSAVSAVAGSCEYGTPSDALDFSLDAKPDLSFNSTQATEALTYAKVTVNVKRVGDTYKASSSVAQTSDAKGTVTVSESGGTLTAKYESVEDFSGASRVPATVLPCLFLPAVLPESLYLPGLASCLMVANVASADADDCTKKFHIVINVTVPVSDRSAIVVNAGFDETGAAAAPTAGPTSQAPSAAPTTTTSSPITVAPSKSASPTTTTSSPTTVTPTTSTVAPTKTTSAPTITTVTPTITTVAPTDTTAAPSAVPTATTAAPTSAAPTSTTAAPTSAAPTITTVSPTTTTVAPTTTTAAPTTTTATPTTTTTAPTTTTGAPTISNCVDNNSGSGGTITADSGNCQCGANVCDPSTSGGGASHTTCNASGGNACA